MKNIVGAQKDNYSQNYKYFHKFDNIMEKGLILNTSYNDFVIGTHVSDYFYKRHEGGVANDSPLSDTVFFDFYEDGVDVWCKNNIIESICCKKNCIYEGVNLIDMKFDDFLNRFHFFPIDEDVIWLEGRDGKNGQNQHVYDFDKEGLQIWVWRNKIRTVIISNYTNISDLILNKSYEEFELNVPVSNYFYKKYEVINPDPIYPFKRYKFAMPMVEIWCKDNMVDSIVCRFICYYEDTNLIGLGYDAFLKKFNVSSPEGRKIYIEVDGRKELRHVYEFDVLGLQLWVWRKRIKTVLVYNAKESRLYKTIAT